MMLLRMEPRPEELVATGISMTKYLLCKTNVGPMCRLGIVIPNIRDGLRRKYIFVLYNFPYVIYDQSVRISYDTVTERGYLY